VVKSNVSHDYNVELLSNDFYVLEGTRYGYDFSFIYPDSGVSFLTEAKIYDTRGMEVEDSDHPVCAKLVAKYDDREQDLGFSCWSNGFFSFRGDNVYYLVPGFKNPMFSNITDVYENQYNDKEVTVEFSLVNKNDDVSETGPDISKKYDIVYDNAVSTTYSHFGKDDSYIITNLVYLDKKNLLGEVINVLDYEIEIYDEEDNLVRSTKSNTQNIYPFIEIKSGVYKVVYKLGQNKYVYTNINTEGGYFSQHIINDNGIDSDYIYTLNNVVWSNKIVYAVTDQFRIPIRDVDIKIVNYFDNSVLGIFTPNEYGFVEINDIPDFTVYKVELVLPEYLEEAKINMNLGGRVYKNDGWYSDYGVFNSGDIVIEY